jgi:hypothetical protein
VTLQKTIQFCDGQVFPIDRDLLMGAFIESLRACEKFKIREGNTKNSKIVDYRLPHFILIDFEVKKLP